MPDESNTPAQPGDRDGLVRVDKSGLLIVDSITVATPEGGKLVLEGIRLMYKLGPCSTACDHACGPLSVTGVGTFRDPSKSQ